MGHLLRRCRGRRGGRVASRGVLRGVSRTGGREMRVTGSGDKVMIGKVGSVTMHFSGYYGPMPKSRVINFIAEKHKVSVREASYVGVVGLSSIRESHLVATR